MMSINISEVCDKIRENLPSQEFSGAFYDPMTDNAVVYAYDKSRNVMLAGRIPRTEIRDNPDIVGYAKKCFVCFADCLDKGSWNADWQMMPREIDEVINGCAPPRLALIQLN